LDTPFFFASRSRLYAFLYNFRFYGRLSRALVQHRKTTAGLATGKILELGPGTGANLRYYRKSVEVILLEINPYMIESLVKKLPVSDYHSSAIRGTAETLPFKDSVFDSVVVTLALASMDRLNVALLEILRVMKKNGNLYFLEHVNAPDKRIRFLQKSIGKLWGFMTCGDKLNCNITEAIHTVGFDHINSNDIIIEGAFPFTKHAVIGSARK